MPTFLTREQLYRVIQRELPPDSYPDGSASAFFSTADSDATAEVLASAYVNLERIYDNIFPQHADESIADHEIKVLGINLPVSLTLEQRRERVLSKLRSQRTLSKPDLIAIVKGVIGADKTVEIIEWNSKQGGWEIGASQLGVETYLNDFRMVDAIPSDRDMCNATPASLGFTDEEWADMQEQAYTYEVLIYSYTPTAEELAEIETELTKAEPARSQHVITSGVDINDLLTGED